METTEDDSLSAPRGEENTENAGASSSSTEDKGTEHNITAQNDPSQESPSTLQNQKEELRSMDGAFVFDTQDEEQLKPSDSMETGDDDPDLIPKHRERKTPLLLFDTDEKKLNLGDFGSLALADIDASLQLPGDELEQLARTGTKRSSIARSDMRMPTSSSSPSSSTSPSGNAVRDRGRLRIHNVGGSLTVLLQIALLAWGIRQLRSVLAKRRQKQAPRINTVPFWPCDMPHFSTLSPLAVQKLVDTNCTPHILIDVRFPEAEQANPLVLKNAVNVPESEVKNVFQVSDTERASRFPFIKNLGRSQLIVFLSTKGRRAQRAAITAAELGYNGCCVLAGGISAFHLFCGDTNHYQPPLLSRDAVALLTQSKKQNSPHGANFPKPYLIDVRRHDERTLYGHIYGSVHVPVFEWPKALVMDPSDYERNYGHSKFGKEDLIILYCRGNNRSAWAAQVASDTGFSRCFISKGGVFGWRLDPNVLLYDAYALGDPPPEPLKFDIEMPDYEAGKRELQHIGVHQGDT